MAAIGQAAGGESGQAQQGEAAQQQGGDLNGLVSQIGQIAQGQEEMRQFLASNPWQAQQQQEGEPPAEEGMDLSWLFGDQQQLEPEAETQQLADRFNQTLKAAVDQQAQALLEPIRQQQEQMRRDAEARDLAAEFPELATPEMAQKIAGQGGLAEQAAQALGRPELAAEPKFWRLVYGFHKAAESANQAPAEGQAAHLESGSGAAPSPSQEDRLKAITQAGDGLGARVLDGM